MIEGRVEITTPVGWEKYDRDRPRNVIQHLHRGFRFMRADNLTEAKLIQDDWLAAFYLRFPGEIRRFPPTPKGIP